MKKSIFVGLVFGLLFVSMIGFVSAQSAVGQNIADFVSSVIEGAKPVLQMLVGDINSAGNVSSDNIFFAKVIILVMLFALIYDILIVSNIFNKPWVMWTISIAVPILGVRFLTPNMVAAAAAPSSALAVSLVAGLPFVLYFFFVEKGLQGAAYPTLRRAAWIFFAAVFAFVWAANSDNPFAWIYLVAVVAAIVMLAIDGTIQRWWAKISFEKKLAPDVYIRITKLNRKRADLEDARIEAVTNGNQAVARDIEHSIANIDNEILNLHSRTR
jgi:hypothetical protein